MGRSKSEASSKMNKLFLRQLNIFLIVLINEFPKVSLQDGLDVMQIIEKAKKSNNLEK